MPDYEKLRKVTLAVMGPAFGDAHDRYFEAIVPKTVLEMLDEREALLAELAALRSAAKPIKRNGYPPEFEEAWAAYPERSNANKIKTFKAWAARVKAGTLPADILAGAKRYASYVMAERTEDRFILQPATFFGPDEHFDLPWTPTKAAGRKGQMHGSIGKQDFNAGVRPDGSF